MIERRKAGSAWPERYPDYFPHVNGFPDYSPFGLHSDNWHILNMEFDANQRRQVLRDFMQSADLNISQWEVLSGLGDGTLRKFMDDTTGKKTLTDRTYTRLAAGASKHLDRIVTIAELQGAADDTPQSNVTYAPEAPALPTRQEMPRDVPVLGTSMGGDGLGEFDLNGSAVDHVRRPPRWIGRTDLFAVYVQGGSMSPWREPGDLAYAESTRPPKTGEYVIVEFQADVHNVRPAIIKKLKRQTPTKIVLEQYQPPKEIEIDTLKTRVRLHRVIDWTELMGS